MTDNKTNITTNDAAKNTKAPYRSPAIRAAGFAVVLVQGAGGGGYDQCGHSNYGC
ncbi:MAG: hypothetical protein KDJ36_13535 [Hyphomicrobiaceae bacterium]|nr:hypothetical protein [Hyphomicrobiaceae bacterium]